MKNKIQYYTKEYLMIILGCFLTAIATNVFMVPNKITPGGFSSIGTLVYYLSNSKIPVGASTLALNIPFFIFGMKIIGKRFIVRTIFSTILLSVFIDITSKTSYCVYYRYFINFEKNSYPDLLLHSIFGGLLMGLGMGLVFKVGATTGGTDVVASLLNYYFPCITMGQSILLMDAIIIIGSAIYFNSFLLALYSIITLIIATKLIDAIIEGVNSAKAVFIISDKHDLISDKIINELKRGVTALNGVGMYTGDNKQVLLCVIHIAQIAELKEFVKEVDDKAFIILSDVREVLGKGFKSYE